MTKIILAFPCMGKTYYAQNHPAKALDLESSDYFFDKTGYEHLTSEEFKGIPNRKPKENGLAEDLNGSNMHQSICTITIMTTNHKHTGASGSSNALI